MTPLNGWPAPRNADLSRQGSPAVTGIKDDGPVLVPLWPPGRWHRSVLLAHLGTRSPLAQHHTGVDERANSAMRSITHVLSWHEARRKDTMKRLFVLAALALSILTGALPAAAASSTGADQVDMTFCHTEPDGYTTCIILQGITTATRTPSGNEVYTGSLHETQVGRLPNGQVDYESTRTIRYHSLAEGELVQVLGQYATSTRTNADGTTCISTYRVRLVHGEIQFEHDETVCT